MTCFLDRHRKAAAERNALGRERDQLRIDVAVATARARRAEEDRDEALLARDAAVETCAWLERLTGVTAGGGE